MKTKYYIKESSCKLNEYPTRFQPGPEYERLENNCSDTCLLANILTGNNKVNVKDLAEGLLYHFQTLTEINKHTVSELECVSGMTTKQARTLKAALELGNRMKAELQLEKPIIKTPVAVVNLFPGAHTWSQEHFLLVCVNSKNKVIATETITIGIADASLIHPREVYKVAIKKHASAIVVAHNHPSGDITPSVDDIKITKQLIEAGKIIGIKLLDHVVLGDGYHSMREKGTVSFS